MKTAELCKGNIKMKADHKDVNFLSLLLRLRRSNNTETPYPFSGKRASKTVSGCFEFSVVERSNHSLQSEQTRTTQSPRRKNAVEFRKWQPPESNVNFETSWSVFSELFEALVISIKEDRKKGRKLQCNFTHWRN